MNSESLDLSRMTVEDLFRAKAERRKRLAQLPFEDKIAIVEKLQTVSKALKGEKPIFAEFLRVYPDFAGESITEWDVVDEWYANRELTPPAHPFDKRPAVIARTASGKRIGVELKSWLNEDQIEAARKQEEVQKSILKAIGEQPRNWTKSIRYVFLSPRDRKVTPKDAKLFQEQLVYLIEQVDKNWTKKPDLEHRQIDYIGCLSEFPILQKYLDGVRFHPSSQLHSDIRWIGFGTRGGAYSAEDMLQTLRNSLNNHKSDPRYKDLKTKVGLDEVYLLEHYDKAFAYNTPFAPFSFKEAAEVASRALNGDGGYFDRIFVFQFLLRKEKAFRIV